MNKYSLLTRIIHWLTALGIIGLIVSGMTMEELGPGPEKLGLLRTHAIVGAVVLLLTIIRIYALFMHRRPDPVHNSKTIESKLFNGVHYGIYIVILWMCISGLWSLNAEEILPALQDGDPNLLPDFRSIGIGNMLKSHHIVAKLVFLLVGIHLIAFVWHWISKKENTLKRII